MHFVRNAFAWLFLIPGIFLGTDTLLAQTNRYLIYFKDKAAGNPFSLSNPSAFLGPRALQRRSQQGLPLDSTDLPVSPAYLTGIANTGGRVVHRIKWSNAAIVECTPAQLTTILELPFVLDGKALNSKRLEPKAKVPSRSGSQSLDYGPSANQNLMLGIDSMHAWGFHGEGMRIAVLDAGFRNVNGHNSFTHLFDNNKIVGTFDLVAQDSDVYTDHWHGGGVLSNIASYAPGFIIGGAYNAEFVLIRTEDDATEHEVECAYWAVGLEIADSAGADLVNSSLGYTTFDNPSLSYSYSTLNGETSIASKAAALAARKGMLVLTSAGNEGTNSSWGGWISVPGDARDILTIGSVGGSGVYSPFSGKGPTADGRIKPDLVAQGGGTTIANVFANAGVTNNNGTSFACPMVCGLAAGLWQAHPGLTALGLIQVLKNSGSNRVNPDNQLGWGIPSFIRAHILAGGRPQLSFPFDVMVYPNPGSGRRLFVEVLDDRVVGLAALRLLDTKGRLVLEDSLNFEPDSQIRQIDLPGVGSGVYQLQMEFAGRQFRKKLLIH